MNTVKVVILGQDPYHNIGQAHGLAFSVKPPTPAPPSLRNMFIGLKNDYPAFNAPPGRNGLLTTWADRGVLLLNASLTVRAHDAGSHSNRGWERFTQRVIDLVAKRRTRGVAFLAWGNHAHKRVANVDSSRHLVLKTVHPSPLSASNGFFTAGHFKKANEWLVTRYGAGSEVDWALVPGQTLFPERKAAEAAGSEGKDAEEKKGEAAAVAKSDQGTAKAKGAVAATAATKTAKSAKGAKAVVPAAPEDEFGDDDLDAEAEAVAAEVEREAAAKAAASKDARAACP